MSDTALRPFRVEFSEDDLNDLRSRIQATRWPEREIVGDTSQGVRLATIQKLARFWASDYDWRTVEARLNAYPQFLTEIDGIDVHFLHVRSRHEDALPMIVTHGWPGSVIEQLKIIGPLTDPTAYGGDASDAFHLVIPSMIGYGFSGKPTAPGWGPDRMASAWIELMRRLGYRKFAAQGGDWGAIVTDLIGVQAPPELVGIHTNMAGATPPEVELAAIAGAPAPAGLSDEERKAYDRLFYSYRHVAYAYEMGDRPQTLTGLADSPVALAAWMIDHDPASHDMIARSIDGVPEGLSPTDVLDNITLFWLTNTALSAARLYWENKSLFFAAKGVTVPVAVSVFPDEMSLPPRSWAEQAYPHLIHYNRVAKGGHFAAWEQPEIFVDEVRTGLRSLRKTLVGAA